VIVAVIVFFVARGFRRQIARANERQ